MGIKNGKMTGLQPEEKLQSDQCRRCGTCCMSGGPALHTEDLSLIKSGKLPLDSLIAIRCGELVNHPLTGKLQTVGYELIKITGTGGDWCCAFYSQERGCTIYSLRPSACRALKCWDTGEISKLVGKNTLNRFDILEKEDPLRALAQEHERLCPCPDMESIRRSVAEGRFNDLPSLQELVEADLAFRSRAVQERQLSLGRELFLFGRPIFQLLQAVGIGISGKGGRILLILP